MARSIDTIYSLIIAEKEAKTELAGLTSVSATAIFKSWAWVTAAVLYTVEAMHDLFRIEIDTLLRTLKPGTLLWYQQMIKEFQYGDALVWTDNGYQYAIIDDTKRIIIQSSVTEGNGGITAKIATEVAGELEPLTAPQLAAFGAYLSARKYAGTRVSLVNSAANKLYLAFQIYYNPLVLSAEGLDLNGAKPVEIAVQYFLRNLPFNGRLRRTALEAAILAVPGVYDVKLTTLQYKYGSNPYVSIDVSAIPESGYFKIDTDHPLADNINYIAGNNNV
jgi:hypothetical protein